MSVGNNVEFMVFTVVNEARGATDYSCYEYDICPDDIYALLLERENKTSMIALNKVPFWRLKKYLIRKAFINKCFKSRYVQIHIGLKRQGSIIYTFFPTSLRCECGLETTALIFTSDTASYMRNVKNI